MHSELNYVHASTLRGLRETAIRGIIEEMKKTQSQRQLPLFTFGALAVLAIGTSFAVGLNTSGDVQTVSPLEASSTRIPGDIDNNSVIDTRDVVVILEIEKGYKTATPDELLADPNADGQLTIDDAIRILNDLSIR